MSETMTVYFASKTGHVLGAVTRAAGTIPTPSRAPSLEDVLVRGGFEGPAPGSVGGVDLTFPGFPVSPEELSTLVVVPDLKVMPAPLKFQVLAQADVVQDLPLNVKVTGISLTFNPTTGVATIKVTVDVAVLQAEPVLFLIAGGALAAPRIAVGVIKQNSTASEDLTLVDLPRGQYHVLALVRGHRPFAAKPA
jgi:hypothetical protein